MESSPAGGDGHAAHDGHAGGDRAARQDGARKDAAAEPIGRPDGPWRDETPHEHLDRLVARAGDQLHLEPPLLRRLSAALVHCSEPQALRGRGGPGRPLRCRLLKHSYLLADGTSQVLWELEHNTGPDDRVLYEVYADPAALAEAEARVSGWFGGTQFLTLDPLFLALLSDAGSPRMPGRAPDAEFDAHVHAPAPTPVDAEAEAEPYADGDGAHLGLDWGPGVVPGPETWSGAALGTGPDVGLDLDLLGFGPWPGVEGPGEAQTAWSSFTPATPQGPRTRPQNSSAEHARRVLRRSENEDCPGEEARRVLGSALAHDTTFVARARGRIGDRVVEWSLFQHAFLLAGGGEFSLWELEHNMAPDGRLMCEVYLGEDAARDSLSRWGPLL